MLGGRSKASRRLIITTGKEVLEVKPSVTWDKGKAINLLIKQTKREKKLTNNLYIYLCDDVSDEEAFKEINRHGNCITIFVGDNNVDSAAKYFLWSPEEVSLFLNWICKKQVTNKYLKKVN